jgi:hypothetical protein
VICLLKQLWLTLPEQTLLFLCIHLLQAAECAEGGSDSFQEDVETDDDEDEADFEGHMMGASGLGALGCVPGMGADGC